MQSCALLKVKEAAEIDFLADNGEEVIRKIPFNDMPGGVIKDVLVAVARNKKDGRNEVEVISDLNVMRVSELRRILVLDAKGLYLYVDGSSHREETMIEALKSSATKAKGTSRFEVLLDINIKLEITYEKQQWII